MAKELHINNLNLDEIVKRWNRVDENGQKIDAIVNSIVNKYCGELDEFVNKVYKMISDPKIDVPDVDIEYMALQLPCLMYFTSDKLEELGIREDIARGFEKESYNNSMLSTEGKVAEKESIAQIASQDDSLITSINSRAYRKIKARIELALETLSSLKKVLSNRITNKELTNRDPNNRE